MPNLRVLAIDDSEDDRYLYRRALASKNDASYELTESSNGEDGLNEAIRIMPDCVLLDYSLPGRNGIEILKRLRLYAPFLPVVILTGQGNETLAVSAIKEGAQNYISKASITSESLKRVIRLSIEHATLERRIHEQKQALEIFTRAMAHDLREPIRTISSFIDLLDGPPLPPEKERTYRRFIKQAAEKMNNLIDSVYDLLSADIRKIETLPKPISVETALDIACNNLHKLITERKAIITHEPLGLCAISEDHLSRVFQNLISNAIQHAKAPPEIHITATEKEGISQIKVADNGPGISPEKQKKLFQPFAKISENPQNLGLGLSICKRIVESYHGSLGFETQEGKGTTFYIQLPKEKSSPTEETEKETQENPQEGAQKLQANILIVDDSPGDIELARYALIEEGRLNCQFHTASTGEEAIKKLGQQKRKGDEINLILLDINMPGLDGFETLQRIKGDEKHKSITTIMCTTSSYEGDIEKATSLGADGYVVKPLTLEALEKSLKRKLPFSLTFGDTESKKQEPL